MRAQAILGDRRPTSLLSKLAMSVRPELFIPYDSRVRNALRGFGIKVTDHCYAEYMAAIISRKPEFARMLKVKKPQLRESWRRGADVPIPVRIAGVR